MAGLWEALMAAMPQQSAQGLYSSLFPEGNYSGFRRSENIEDRRRQRFAPTPGVFGDGVNTGNVFDNGLLTGLKPTDFATSGMEAPTGLSVDAGVRDIIGAMRR